MNITLPWPDHDLHPNARIIWQIKQLRVREAREYAKYFTLSTINDMTEYPGSIKIIYTFYPPNKAHRDLDNMIANMKPALDGIMDGLRTNDNQIIMISAIWGAVIKGGAVVVEITAA